MSLCCRFSLPLPTISMWLTDSPLPQEDEQAPSNPGGSPLTHALQAPAARCGRCQGMGTSPALSTPVPGDKISSLKKKKKAKAVPPKQEHSLFSGSVSLTRSQKQWHCVVRCQSRTSTGCPTAGKGHPASCLGRPHGHTLSWHVKKHFSSAEMSSSCPPRAASAP